MFRIYENVSVGVDAEFEDYYFEDELDDMTVEERDFAKEQFILLVQNARWNDFMLGFAHYIYDNSYNADYIAHIWYEDDLDQDYFLLCSYYDDEVEEAVKEELDHWKAIQQQCNPSVKEIDNIVNKLNTFYELVKDGGTVEFEDEDYEWIKVCY